MPARTGCRRTIPTVDILEAVDWLGVRWPLLFADEEITSVNAALDRELLAETMVSAYELSPAGRRWLDEHLGDGPRGALAIEQPPGCREHVECLSMRCTRCGVLRRDHLPPWSLADEVRAAMADHVCTIEV